jgi:hypothetical protein
MAKRLNATRFKEPLGGEEPEWVRIAATAGGERCPMRLENATLARKRHRRGELII